MLSRPPTTSVSLTIGADSGPWFATVTTMPRRDLTPAWVALACCETPMSADRSCRVAPAPGTSVARARTAAPSATTAPRPHRVRALLIETTLLGEGDAFSLAGGNR